MGIEPTLSAWKAEVLPLNYTRLWWREEDSNLRRLSQQIYSLPPLATRVPLREIYKNGALESLPRHKRRLPPLLATQKKQKSFLSVSPLALLLGNQEDNQIKNHKTI